MSTILVTGGTGYIGSHTVVELQQAGHHVVIIDNLSNSRLEVIDWITQISGIKPDFYKVDICNLVELEQCFQQLPKIDGVIHFAAFKSVNESVAEPLKYYHNNIASLVNLLRTSIAHGIKPFVFSSSCTVYGQPEKLPVSENTPLAVPSSPYGVTKQLNEVMLRDMIAAGAALDIIALRYFNPIGAHDSALIGELPIGIPNNLVPYITQTGIGIRKELKVFGGDYDTADGSAVRDYIHVVDLAKAHVIAVSRLLEHKNKAAMEIFNLGTGIGYTVLQTVKSFERVSGNLLPHQVVDRRPGDVAKIWADTTLANEELGWKAERDLDNMLLTAWNWEKYFRNNIEKTIQ